MAGIDIKIDDDYVEKAGVNIKNWSNALQQNISAYINILDDITTTGITSGSTHDALVAFKQYAENLKDVIGDIGEDSNTLCQNFLSAVDETDSYLY